MAADGELQPVGARQGVGRQIGGLVGVGGHAHQGLLGVIGRQDQGQLLGRGLAPQIAVVELDGGGHAPVVVVHHRAEHRRGLQAGDLLHLGQVLVF